jgi:hypothetical protein
MMQKTMTAVLALGACTIFARDARFADAPYMNPRLPTEERMNDLISKMEMREKVAVLCTTAGFKMYEIRDGEVYVAKTLEELYAKFPGCGLGSFFRADWFSGRNWKTGLRPEMLIRRTTRCSGMPWRRRVSASRLPSPAVRCWERRPSPLASASPRRGTWTSPARRRG